MIKIDFGPGRPTNSYGVETVAVQDGLAVTVEPGVLVCQKIDTPPGFPPVQVPLEAVQMLGEWVSTEDEDDRHVLAWHEKAELAVTESEAVVTLKSGGGETRFPLTATPEIGWVKAIRSTEGRVSVRIDVEKLRDIAADFGSTGDLTLHIDEEGEPVIVAYDESPDRFAIVMPLPKEAASLGQNEAYREALGRKATDQ